MANYLATVRWARGDARFTANRYSRAHTPEFDGGTVVPASASPHIVRPPLSDPAGVDPEEAFVAALSSCHLLWFLSIAAQRGFIVDSYVDEAAGVMAKNVDGRLAMTIVTLRPRVIWTGERQPGGDDVAAIHHAAHEQCLSPIR